MWRDHVTEIVVFLVLFAVVSVAGFASSRWRSRGRMADLDEWGLGGRRFGSWVTWFLIGGDLYTAYTFVAIPALLYGAGAAGFFAIPYSVITYPIVFFVLARFWDVSRRNGFVTPADLARARFGSPTLALLVALTGIVATMPYIALQLVGLEATLRTMGLTGQSGWAKNLPIIIAFAILAAYTYKAGLRASALTAFVKDGLIYVVIIAAVVYLPGKLGGWSGIFDAAQTKFAATPSPSDGITLPSHGQLQYITLALGSALALFLYPHSATGVLAARSKRVVMRNMAALPAYSVLLGFVALLGYMAIAAGVKPLPGSSPGTVDGNTVVPQLFDHQFPAWLAGLAFAAIGIGALIPAGIMSIAAANLFTRNIYREFFDRDAGPAREASVAKLASLVVKVGALLCIVLINPQFSVDLQLIGGVIILQTLPAVALGLYVRWLHRGALIAGWAAGMVTGMWMLYRIPNPATHHHHFGGSAFPLSDLGFHTTNTIYVGIVAVLVNLVVSVAGSLLLNASKVSSGVSGEAVAELLSGTPATASPAEPAPAR
ncbi:solute:Na+ symporter, SSS family protein [Paractinoplanes deccanensis]|uniref:Solute:Na+ symporter, SSS family protein n=1 Tax=Paractinoplanes deccanensis TaxID=113561 RepID=A0ABQ3Y367_9ACTN|nr:sodium:solute symporter [Actinoplanes deccanensis]GID74418.1 solute:Na+ symporter, SSS family protein [Actinoplanes deccanensis]